MATPGFLIRLMQFTGLSRSIKLGPEDSEAYRFATDLRAAALEGRLLCVFIHPANELAGITRVDRQGRRRALPQAATARALGLITGASDYLFLFGDGSLVIEFKSADGRLTPAQRDFRDWCKSRDVPFHLARSRVEALDVLRDAGLYLDEKPS
ncbi:hypothetical protein F1640_18435 [Novosphingobium sp. NBM11]|uniref:hypothetical protein n=1 Tax=Novosphingobium sp. NBM11 TaxID=2596914 RepID=UPI0018927093|nr:hypothetical protein [Novosphingobium sp. NBM11]MBF5091934.1 hypothetical protein [Novosphingobium sp. NBM11]